MSRPLKIVTWNVNGLRACARSQFLPWLEAEAPDVLCLQETKAAPEQLQELLERIEGYRYAFHSAERKGYSGVATFSRHAPLDVRKGIGIQKFDAEGRVLVTAHPGFVLYNAYFPNGGRDLGRVDFKLEFYAELLKEITVRPARGERVIVCGDFNTAHRDIDLKNPKSNQNTSGFLPHERVWVSRYVEAGFVDIFRTFHPEGDQYTWWSYMFDARRRNIGWRIDYFLVSQNAAGYCQDAYHLTSVGGSDHCPVALLLDAEVSEPLSTPRGGENGGKKESRAAGPAVQKKRKAVRPR